MYIQIKKGELVPDKFGQHIKNSMVGIYDETGKWIKWVKLNTELLQLLLNNKINVEDKK